MNRSLKVKKIWSLNPTKFKKITLKEASEGYMNYVADFIALGSDGIAKDFINWLESEI